MNDWHIRCSKCRDVIGLWPDNPTEFTGRANVHPLVRCYGKGEHPRPIEKSSRTHWMIVEEFLFYYPETHTEERAYRYVGIPWWPLLALALLFIVKRRHGEHFKKIRVGGKVVIWLPHQLTFWKKLRKIFSRDAFGRPTP